MIAEAIDLLDESTALHAVLAPLDEDALAEPTAFKQWTPNDIVAHLHFFNELADLALTDEGAFERRYAAMAALRGQGLSMREATDRLLGGLAGRALIDRWREYLSPMATRWHAADPRQRVKWVGPSMSARSSISARLMETWAHGQAIYDRLGIERVDTDRIESIAVMGVNTFGWTFRNRGLEVPAWRPSVRLRLPGGAIREWPAQAIEVEAGSHASPLARLSQLAR
ncbi:MAG: maleylpyruvate isomerase family mycothiol-dependent enzyme [Lautropia sp.]